MHNNRSGIDALRDFLEDKFWEFMIAIMILPCALAFTTRRTMTADADFLGGKAEIERFLSINVRCLVIALVALVIEIVLFALFCVGKRNNAKKIGVFVLCIFVVSCTSVMFGISVAHIRSDLSHTTVAAVDDYVLSTSGGSYYVGFTDQDTLTQIPVEKSTYDALAKGTDKVESGHSEIYSAVNNAGYSDVTEYHDKARIEYYFYSAMIVKAELAYTPKNAV